MGKLLFLFIVGAIALLFRLILLEPLEWHQAAPLLLFLPGALLIWLIQRRIQARDAAYQPKQPDNIWNTRIGERMSTGRKLLYKGSRKQAAYYRYYPHWWQYAINEIINGGGKWYMNLCFELKNGEKIKFIEQRKKKKQKGNTTWHISQKEQVIGQVQTDYSIKNALKLQEGLFLQINSQTYYFQSFGIGSKTEIRLNQQVIAAGWRSDSLQCSYCLKVTEGHEAIEPLLMMAFILFNYVHEQ
ncbi:hypothetical protein [Bacillus xiapuensis]|uniref:hypothetical protein n=1 Tax=Bacillus xiapuensis TaxID=2014075 RepID=UPI000C2412F8|nr:hypothetical protein [Bacillus xiapuensis]